MQRKRRGKVRLGGKQRISVEVVQGFEFFVC